MPRSRQTSQLLGELPDDVRQRPCLTAEAAIYLPLPTPSIPVCIIGLDAFVRAYLGHKSVVMWMDLERRREQAKMTMEPIPVLIGMSLPGAGEPLQATANSIAAVAHSSLPRAPEGRGKLYFMNKPSEDAMAPKPTTSRSSSAGPTATMPTDQDVLTLDEAAIFLKCDPATIKRRAKVLHMPHRRLGSLWRFYKPALIAWMEEGEDQAA